MAMTMDDQVARVMLNSQGTIQIIVFKLPSIVRQGDRDLASKPFTIYNLDN